MSGWKLIGFAAFPCFSQSSLSMFSFIVDIIVRDAEFGGGMDDLMSKMDAREMDKDVTIQVLAHQAKHNYKELLVYRAFAQLLKSNGFEDVVQETLNDARRSAPVRTNAALYESAIDAMIPPPLLNRMQEEVRKALAALPIAGRPT